MLLQVDVYVHLCVYVYSHFVGECIYILSIYIHIYIYIYIYRCIRKIEKVYLMYFTASKLIKFGTKINNTIKKMDQGKIRSKNKKQNMQQISVINSSAYNSVKYDHADQLLLSGDFDPQPKTYVLVPNLNSRNFWLTYCCVSSPVSVRFGFFV